MVEKKSELTCPFCKTPMEEVYISLVSGQSARLYSSKEELSSLTGGLGKQKDIILENMIFSDHLNNRKGYRCSNCMTFIIGTQDYSDSNNKLKKSMDRVRKSMDRTHYHSSNFSQK